jgi:hypothetical protein
MKKVIVSTFFLLILSMTFAQSPKEKIAADPRIIEVFGQETVDFYLENNPSLIQYYNYFLENSYSIQEIPQEKMGDLQTIPELKRKEKFQSDFIDYTEKGLENLNIMKFDLKIDPNIGSIYRLGNTNKIIVFLSGNEIQNKYNKYIIDLK